jgi:tetratricopeptide (TPR) repeat protein
MSRRFGLITSIMLITFVGAVYVAIVSERTLAGFGLRVLAVFWMSLSGCLLLTWSWLVVVPSVSRRLAFGNPNLQRRILGWVILSPFSPASKVHARFVLAVCDQAANRHAEAEVLYRLILHDNAGRTVPEFESLVRQRLAATLDALGRPDAARAESARAAAALERGPETLLTMHTKAKLLEREQHYADAYTAYERAFALASPAEQAKCFELKARLSHCALRSGQAAESLRWATAVVDHDPKGPFGVAALFFAANAAVSLGRLDDAERYAYTAANLSRTDQQHADARALIAHCEMRRGNLDDAERRARAAAALATVRHSLPWMTLANVAAQRGCFDDAIRALEQAIKPLEGQTDRSSRRELATIQLLCALYQAEAGRNEVALTLLRQAKVEHAGDGKELVAYHLSAALVCGLANERDLARAQIAAAEQGRTQFLSDGATQRAAYLHLGRAALLIGEPEQARSWLRSYLELTPDPLYLPCTYYLLAESCRLLGDAGDAEELYGKAASSRIGTRWEDLARQRLAASGASAQPQPA